MKHAILFSLLTVTAISHAQTAPQPRAIFSAHAHQGDIDQDGHVEVYSKERQRFEFRRVEAITFNPAVREADVKLDDGSIQPADSFPYGSNYTEFDTPEDFLVRTSQGSRRQASKMEILRINKRLGTYPDKPRDYRALEVFGGDSGLQIIQGADIDPAKDQIVAAKDIGKFIRDANPNITVEVADATWSRLWRERDIFDMKPQHPEVIQEMLKGLLTRKNVTAAKLAGYFSRKYGFASPINDEVAEMLKGTIKAQQPEISGKIDVREVARKAVKASEAAR
jgi:hypothetical protein